MTEEQQTLELSGCSPVPLSHYLKALGILRIVSEQVDAHAQGWWRDDTFFLSSSLNRDRLLEFFLNEYRPTPLVGPWGARSGFFSGSSEKSARDALDQIVTSKLVRVEAFQRAIAAVGAVLSRLGLEDKADSAEQKHQLMMTCRAMFDDDLLPWLDATYVLLETKATFPPLLGTGGNEGSGSYMSGFAQQVVSVLVNREWDHALAPALFSDCDADQRTTQTPGHFSPEAAGGPNASRGFSGNVGTNPWDYLIMLEGTLLFAAGCVRKLENHTTGTLGFPFCVRPSGVGYGSSAPADELTARAEIWIPLWSLPSTFAEVRELFSEGRATVNRRAAKNGIDFARAVSSYGIDRGITAFERYGFHQRNGLSYFAVSLGRFIPTRWPQVDLVDEIDDWLDHFRSKARSDTAPARMGRALRRLEAAIIELCRQSSKQHVEDVLIALGEVEMAMARSPRWRAGAFVRPVPALTGRWLDASCDDSPEWRLAASLASVHDTTAGPLRRHIDPVHIFRNANGSPWVKWSGTPNDPTLVWGGGGLIRNLISVLRRRVIEYVQHGKAVGQNVFLFPSGARYTAGLGDVTSFINGEVDDERIEALLKGLMLIDWQRVQRRNLRSDSDESPPGAAYALLKLCNLPFAVPPDDVAVPLTPTIIHRAAAGDIVSATRLAARRLQASGLPPAVDLANCSPDASQRIVAALMFPIAILSARQLATFVLKPRETAPLESDEAGVVDSEIDHRAFPMTKEILNHGD